MCSFRCVCLYLILYISLYHSPFTFWDRFFSLNLELDDLARLPSQSSLGFPCFCLLILGLQAWAASPIFPMGARDLSSALHTCTTSPIPTEPSLWPFFYLLLWLIDFKSYLWLMFLACTTWELKLGAKTCMQMIYWRSLSRKKTTIKDWEEKDRNWRHRNDSSQGSDSAWSHGTFTFQSLPHLGANVAGFSALSLY